MFHVERVRGGVSPGVMVAVVMIGGCRGRCVGDDGAVGSMGVWRWAGDVVQQPLGLRYMSLQEREARERERGRQEREREGGKREREREARERERGRRLNFPHLNLDVDTCIHILLDVLKYMCKYKR